MNCEDFGACPPKQLPEANMHREAEFIAQALISRDVLTARGGLQRLRDDVLNLPGADLLKLQTALETAANKRGMDNPLMRRPEIDNHLGFPAFTGNEMVVMTNPFDGKVESVRKNQEHSLPKDHPTMMYFRSSANMMVDHWAAVQQLRNEEILGDLQISDR
jgi:hypothetical protein